MPNIEKYKSERRKTLIYLCIEGLLFFGLAFFIMKDGDDRASLAMFMMPLLMIPFVQYTAISTKIEILKDLQDTEKDADRIAQSTADSKFLTPNLVCIIITGLAILGFIGFVLQILSTVLSRAA